MDGTRRAGLLSVKERPYPVSRAAEPELSADIPATNGHVRCRSWSRPKPNDQPIAYYSCKLLDRERNYSTIEKECLAIVLAVKAFAIYLLGKPFVLQTDNRVLVWLETLKDKNA